MVLDTGLRYNLPELMTLAQVALDVHENYLELNTNLTVPPFDYEYVVQTLCTPGIEKRDHQGKLFKVRNSLLQYHKPGCESVASQSLEALQTAFPEFLTDLEGLSEKISSTLHSDRSTASPLTDLTNSDDLSNDGDVMSSDEQDDLKLNQCPTCLEVCSKRSDLAMHIRRHTGQRSFACPHSGCGKAFDTSSDMTKHTRAHTGEKPFICSKAGCGKAFATSSGLAVHTRTHPGEKPYVCQVQGCNQAYSTRGSRVKHTRNHHDGHRPFVCTFPGCNKSFSSKSDLANHHNKHTGAKPFVCTSTGCSKAYASSSARNAHARKEHEQ